MGVVVVTVAQSQDQISFFLSTQTLDVVVEHLRAVEQMCVFAVLKQEHLLVADSPAALKPHVFPNGWHYLLAAQLGPYPQPILLEGAPGIRGSALRWTQGLFLFRSSSLAQGRQVDGSP